VLDFDFYNWPRFEEVFLGAKGDYCYLGHWRSSYWGWAAGSVMLLMFFQIPM